MPSLRHVAHRLGEIVLVLAAVQAPLLYGAAAPRALTWLLLLSSLSLLLAPAPLTRRVLILASIVAAALLAWGSVSFVQIHDPLGLGASAAIPIVKEARALLGLAGDGSGLTLNPARFPDTLLRACLVASALWCGLLYGQDRNAAFRCLFAIVVAGLLTNAAALAWYMVEPGLVLWRPKLVYVKEFTATFVNRGAAGAWLCLMAVASLLLIVRIFDRLMTHFVTDDASMPKRLLLCFFAEPARITVLGVLCVGALVGILLTGSRAAGLILAFNLCVVLGVVWYFRKGSIRALLALSLVAVLAGLAVFQLAGATLGDRVAQGGLVEEGRWEIWTSTIRAIGQRPWLGYGPGTFRDVFPLFRGMELAGVGEVQKAHSLPIEMAAEHGVPLAVFLGLVWLGLCLWLLVGLLRSVRFDAIRTIGALAAISAVGFVSIDVVSHTFGYVLPLLLMVGLALGQPTRTADDRDRDAMADTANM